MDSLFRLWNSGCMALDELLVFARVVQAGSFTAAAKALAMPKSSVSRKVSALEERLGVRLLQRTTRKLGLTDAGRAYHEHAARIASEVEDAERAVRQLDERPRGLLRVTAPLHAAFLGPIVDAYLQRFPDVRIELHCTARSVDLVEERYDVGIRAGALADSSLVARTLGVSRWLLAAAPSYLASRGRPRTPAELKAHDCLVFGTGETAVLRFVRRDETARVTVSPRLAASDMDIVHDAVLGGRGIAMLPAFQLVEALRARRLERVLPDWDAPATPVHLVYPSAHHVSPKVRTFVEHVLAHMTPLPWELAADATARRPERTAGLRSPSAGTRGRARRRRRP